MGERVVGYREVEVDVITSRPVVWDGVSSSSGFRELEPVREKKILLEPIYKDLGRRTFTTLDGPVLPIRETPLWGINTDDATGKHKKEKKKK